MCPLGIGLVARHTLYEQVPADPESETEYIIIIFQTQNHAPQYLTSGRERSTQATH